ncbi:hypothetical protein LMG9964_06159 [Paraburkholderia phenoliruptrix]|uniref:Uncharacterized protein n=1 Tax=Paraburkholderia phenoliruptrix TaxID=252970 RepID=A0A6J5KE30_9BURK|nr:hypothetical protein LMG9964_06159 [Paraburkholderia phenoliruptrix]
MIYIALREGHQSWPPSVADMEVDAAHEASITEFLFGCRLPQFNSIRYNDEWDVETILSSSQMRGLDAADDPGQLPVHCC